MHEPWFSQLQTSLDDSESVVEEVVVGGDNAVVGRGELQSLPSKHSHEVLTHVVFGGHCIPAQISV